MIRLTALLLFLCGTWTPLAAQDMMGALEAHSPQREEIRTDPDQSPPLAPSGTASKAPPETISETDPAAGKNPGSFWARVRKLLQELHRNRSTASGTVSPDPKVAAREALYGQLEGLRGAELRDRLQALMTMNRSVGYQRAQDLVFTSLDNRNGVVTCVYTGRRLETSVEPDPRNMNIEHTWPQSKGATGIAKSDLHHIFPADAKVNHDRGHLPFGKVSFFPWFTGGSSHLGQDRFEVRREHRGNVARAIFYFAVRYGKNVPPEEEAVLRRWAKEDPVDDAERLRNDRIEGLQGNRNAFVDHPEFIDAIPDF